jgi:ADP-ribosyl-[dinitrogen reductase] hydrolase
VADGACARRVPEKSLPRGVVIMMLEIGIGDAYGAGFEYVDEKAVRDQNNLAGYVRHPRHRLKPGCYTDDTQMSIAVAEAVLSAEPWTPRMLAQRFLDAFRRDKREGYAQSFYDFLQTVRDADDFLSRIQPFSDKSGAAMRAGPIGLFPEIPDVIQKARVQAAITHNTPDGINAAVAASLITHYFVNRLGNKAGLGTFVQAHVPGSWSVPWQGKVGPKGWMSVRAAITAVMQSSSMSEILTACVSFTGDVDTVAAIACAAGSWSEEIEQDVPAALVNGLEDGQFGRRFLIQLDERLVKHFSLRGS